MKARVIYISDLPNDVIKKIHMSPAKSLDEAVKLAKKMLDKVNITITAIPDGVSVVVICCDIMVNSETE